MIKAEGLTLAYHNKKGVFNLDFTIKDGQVMGYLGPNGAGKTTTIRLLMGFMNPTSGVCSINSQDCFYNAAKLQKSLGYIPGETAFIEGMSGEEYLKFISNMRGEKNLSRQKELMNMFDFSPKGQIKKFSKGMKQKLGIISAFMNDAQTFILDEPTSGLDPLMQSRFVELILAEKAKGKTILMSSHMFEEIEKTCDNVLIIKDGKIVAQSDIATLKNTKRKGFRVKTTQLEETIKLFESEHFKLGEIADNGIVVYTTGENVDKFIKILAQFTNLELDSIAQSLEDVFMDYYENKDAPFKKI